jgi:hypothetical protein
MYNQIKSRYRIISGYISTIAIEIEQNQNKTKRIKLTRYVLPNTTLTIVRSVRFGSVRFSSVRFSSVQFVRLFLQYSVSFDHLLLLYCIVLYCIMN